MIDATSLRLSDCLRRAARVLVAGVLLAAALAASARGPVPPPPASVTSPTGDPPGRIGRLSEFTGPTWLFSPSQGEWIAAPLNRPLTSGDRLATDAGARATVRIGSTTLRLDGGSELELLTVDDDRLQLQVHEGSLAVRLRAPQKAAELQVLTGEGRVAFDRAGRYRIDRRDATTHLTVWSGEARFEAPGTGSMVYPRQRAEFWFDSREGRVVYSLTDPREDAFSAWVAGRDYQDGRSAAGRYVSPEMTGAEDLDRWGQWEEHGEYGTLWIPREVPPGWAPYRTGQWQWIAPWGWTWIDEAPWGFAPFHYGRWVWWRDRWAWAPGRWVARPVYAPALVAWIGGPGLSVGVSIGGGRPVGWFPLGPSEVYVPWYSVTPGYVQQVNITHVTRIDNVQQIVASPGSWVGRQPYQHRWREPAVTVVPEPQFGRQPVAVGASRWILDPSVRSAWTDPSRGTGVVPDPGVRPGVPPPVGRVPSPPVAPGAGRPPIAITAPDRPPPGAVEPDRRLHIPERVIRTPEPPAAGGGLPPGGRFLPPPSAVVPPPAATIPPVPGVRPPGAVPPVPTMPPASPAPGVPGASGEDPARRIGRPAPAVREGGPSWSAPPAVATPAPAPAQRPVLRPEPPPLRAAEPVRVPAPEPARDRDRREQAR